jgi:hypothetical protein
MSTMDSEQPPAVLPAGKEEALGPSQTIKELPDSGKAGEDETAATMRRRGVDRSDNDGNTGHFNAIFSDRHFPSEQDRDTYFPSENQYFDEEERVPRKRRQLSQR